jgi:periplasmic protein CpxP/Spy
MTFVSKPRLIALVLACASAYASAQPSGAHPQRGMDPAHRQEMMVKRQAELKAKLQLAPAQEGAWAQWTESMKPPAEMAGKSHEDRRKMHEEMAKLTTPERIDRMNAMKAQRDAEMARRADATKTFYAALTPQQQKTFDENMRRRGPGGPGGHHGPGGMKAPQQG